MENSGIESLLDTKLCSFLIHYRHTSPLKSHYFCEKGLEPPSPQRDMKNNASPFLMNDKNSLRPKSFQGNLDIQQHVLLKC